MIGRHYGTGYGVLGWSTGGAGVYGQCDDPNGGTGVVGSAQANGYGVFAVGRLGASGTKSFVIDHPLEPENKELMHYCAEGPEPRNVYQGHVTTGTDGYAWVQLPDYYSSINRDPEYTLTVLDESADFVLAKVTKKVDGNQFQIRTSKGGVEVSWRVEGIRNDRFVATYGAPTEKLKPAADRGLYVQPELYGLPREYGINAIGRKQGTARAHRP